MLKSNIFQTTSILTGILVITILLSKSIDAASINNDGNLFRSKRATTTTNKCAQTLSGSYYDGSPSPLVGNVNSYQDCIALCNNDSVCYGWRYQSSTNSCWHQTSIGTQYTDSSMMGGSCIGPAMKEPCTQAQVTSGYYSGSSGSAIKNVATNIACMNICNADLTCLGWSYESSATTCWTQTTVYGLVSGGQYVAGSCIIPQAPYPPISLDTCRQQALDEHNLYRNKHCAPSTALDSDLNTIAQNYAEKLAATMIFQHSGGTYNGNPMGENLYMSVSSYPWYLDCSDAVIDWYSEIESYSWSNPVFSSSYGHFTQSVWSNSTKVGIGRAFASDNKTQYTVANYYPAGNINGLFATGVPKLC